MADAIEAAGVRLTDTGSVVALGKAPILRDAANPIRFAGGDVKQCGLLIVTHWGDERQPIPARMGGPVAVAIPDACSERYGDKAWVTFLEELKVEP
jgi:hypothetical protein